MRLSKRRPGYSFETNSDFLGGIIIGVGITMLFCVICFGLYYLSNRGKQNEKDKEKEKKEKNKIKENFENFDIDAHNRDVDDIHSNNLSNSISYEYYTPSPSQSMHDFGRIADDYFNRYILRE
jgi:hypothetical protein